MEVSVRLHGVLREHAGGRSSVDIPLADGATVGELLDVLAERIPAVERRIRDETGTLRRHVNLFVDAQQVRALGGVDYPLRDGAEVLVLPAVSGG
jgi:sulfur-carrier protein